MASNEPDTLGISSTWTARKIIAAVLVVLSVILGFLLVVHFREVVILVFTGIIISISMEPAVNWLQQYKIPGSLCVILIYLLLILLLLVVILLIIPPAIQQISALIPMVGKYYQNLQSFLISSPNPLLRQLAENFAPGIDLIPKISSPGTQTGSPNLVSWTINIGQSFLSGLFTLTVVLLIGFYWTLEGEPVLYSFLLLFPMGKRDSARKIIEDIEGRVGGFVRGQIFLALMIGLAALLSYLIIGLPSPLSLAFLAAVFELVPLFGPILGAAPAVLVALSYDPSKVLWVVAASIFIQFLENHLLAPRVMQKTVGVNPIVTILAIVSFGSLFGFSGLLLAIPLAAVFQVLLDRSFLHPQTPFIEVTGGRDRISKLMYEAQELVRDVRKRIRTKEVGNVDSESDEVEDAIESIAADLDNFLSQLGDMDGSE